MGELGRRIAEDPCVKTGQVERCVIGGRRHPECAEAAALAWDDQATPHDEWSSVQSDKLLAIRHLHRQGEEKGGIVSGFCAECGWQYPCPTVHIANGWGEIHDCEDAGWCKHAGVPLTLREDR